MAIRARCCVSLFLAALVVDPSRGAAQSGLKDFGCSPTVANPDCRSGGGGFSRVDEGYLRMQQLRPRVEAMLRDLSAFGVPALDGVSSNLSRAGTVDQLGDLIDRAYVSAEWHARRLRGDVEEMEVEIPRMRALAGSLQQTQIELESQLTAVHEKEANATEREASAEAQVEAEERLFGALRDTGHRMSQRQVDTRDALRFWLVPFLPETQAAAVSAALANDFRFSGGEDWVFTQPPAEAAPIEEALAAAPSPPLRDVPMPAPPSGAPEARFTALQQVAADLETLVPAWNADVRAAEQARREMFGWSDRVWDGRSQLDAADRSVRKIEGHIRQLETRVADALLNQRIEARNALKWAAVAYVWDSVKRTKVMKPVMQMIAVNRLAARIEGTDDGMKRLWYLAREKNPLVPPTGRWEGIERVRMVGVQVIDLAQNTESFMQRAAEVNAYGSPEDAQALSDEIFTELGERGSAILRIAANGIPGPLGSLAQRIVARGVASDSAGR